MEERERERERDEFDQVRGLRCMHVQRKKKNVIVIRISANVLDTSCN